MRTCASNSDIVKKGSVIWWLLCYSTSSISTWQQQQHLAPERVSSHSWIKKGHVAYWYGIRWATVWRDTRIAVRCYSTINTWKTDEKETKNVSENKLIKTYASELDIAVLSAKPISRPLKEFYEANEYTLKNACLEGTKVKCVHSDILKTDCVECTEKKGRRRIRCRG